METAGIGVGVGSIRGIGVELGVMGGVEASERGGVDCGVAESALGMAVGIIAPRVGCVISNSKGATTRNITSKKKAKIISHNTNGGPPVSFGILLLEKLPLNKLWLSKSNSLKQRLYFFF